MFFNLIKAKVFYISLMLFIVHISCNKEPDLGSGEEEKNILPVSIDFKDIIERNELRVAVDRKSVV